MTISSKRAEHIAWASLILSVIFFGIAYFVGRWSGSFAIYAAGWQILSAALIWFVLAMQFHQRALAEQEKLDMSQLAKAEHTSTIFQAKGDQALFAVAQKRLELFEKWFLPVFSGLIAVYQAGMGLYLLKMASVTGEYETKQPLTGAICMTAIAFISFLMSRYATGMSAQMEWKPLRAGGSSMLGAAIFSFILALALSLAQFHYSIVVNVINWAIPILLVIIGAETALNIIFDIYRPRLKGQYSRSAFDSRLLGIINEPGNLFRSAATAIDYQFGFKVSQTWFYRLLEKAIMPLILFAVVVLYFMSCIVVIAPNEEAVIEHFGNPVDSAGKVRLIGPGLALKWPWPVDIAYTYPTKKVSEISIGYVPKIDPLTNQEISPGPLLWGKAHYEKEYNLLVASGQMGTRTEEGAVPVSLIIASMPVQYRVKDLYSYIYNHNEPKQLLESICYRELTRFAASARIEVDNESDMSQSLLGAGRAAAERVLKDRIQAAADHEKLGIEIVFLGLQGLHPPPEVAADYQKVVGAVQTKEAMILYADANSNRTLSTLTGSVKEADELYNLAAQYQLAKEQNDSQKMEKLAKDLDAAFAQASGDIFSTLRQAQSYAFERITVAKATGQRFAEQLKAYRAGKEIYKRQQRLAAMEEALANTRKYIVVAGREDKQVMIVDLQEKLTPGLYDITGIEENK